MPAGISRLTALLAACAVLSSCAFHHYVINPPPGNTAWDPEPASAIILLGFVSDEQFNSIAVAGDVEAISVPGNILPLNELNVLAVHFRVGETFRFVGANYMSLPSASLTFEDLPAITIDEPGVYYYGFFQSQERKGGFTAEFSPRVVAKARQLYPQVFRALEPVNFMQ